jgi:hypothetical protein
VFFILLSKLVLKQFLVNAGNCLCSGALPTNAAGELDVLWHDGHTFGVDGAKVGVFEETNEVGLGGFLEGEDSGALETEVVLELGGDLTDKSLEGKLADEELGGLLETSDLTESDGAWSEAVGFLDTTGSGGLLDCGLVGDVLSGGLATSVLASSVLCACHCLECIICWIKSAAFIVFTLKISNSIGYCRI